MKLFVNDWDISLAGQEEKRQYNVNSWINIGKQTFYFLSAYVYEDFVMILLTAELGDYKELIYKPTTPIDFNNITQYDNIISTIKMQSCILSLPDIEINGLQRSDGRGCAVLPIETGVLNEEYDYITEYVKNENRLPEELANKELMYYKYCVSFTDKIDKINQLTMYPVKYESVIHGVEKSFNVPFGECDIKIQYTQKDTGEESYIIAKELRKYNHIQSMRESEMSKNLPEIFKDMPEEEVLILDFLKPEERRSHAIHTNKYLGSKIMQSCMSTIFMFSNETETDSGLYKYSAVLDKIKDGIIDDSYDLTLMYVTDTFETEHKPFFDISFKEF